MRARALTIATVVAAAMAATSVTAITIATPAQAEVFAFSFDTGNVRFAYADGYYDHRRVWHPWSEREAREFRVRYRDRYWDGPRTRYPNRGWRDKDGDGVPNKFDDRPNNPYRD